MAKQDLLETFIQRQEDFMEDQKSKLDKIVRALYGEEENGVKGIVHRVNSAESKIEAHEEFNKKFVWGFASVGLTIEIGWHAFKAYFLKQ